MDTALETAKYKQFDYVIRYPDGYSPGKRCPLVIFLHGAGSRGRNIDLISSHPFFSETEKFKEPLNK